MTLRIVEVGSLSEFRRLTMQANDPGSVFLVYTGQAHGAIPNGTRVRKCKTEEGDSHALGALATVVGSLGAAGYEYGYWVRWDDIDEIPCFVRGSKIERVP